MCSKLLLLVVLCTMMLHSEPRIIVKPFANTASIDLVQGTVAKPFLASSLQQDGDLTSSLLPYSLLITNNTDSTIIGYTLNCSITSANGESRTRNRIFYNFGIKENGIEIAPGQKQLATPFASYRLQDQSKSRASTLGANPQAVQNWIAEVQKEAVVVLSLDLVILDSGKVHGVNDSGTLEGLMGFYRGQAEAISIVRSALARDLPAADIAKQLSQKFEEARQNNSRDAVARSSEFRAMARIAERSRDELINEVNRLEGSRRHLSFTR